MRVIFEKTFLENLKRIDNAVKLTKYSIGTYYGDSSINSEFINNLFSGRYLFNDIRKTSESLLYSIWEKEDKLLKINITIPDKEKEGLVDPNSNHCFIYCYGLYPDMIERIAFILIDPEIVNGQIIKFGKLNLNLSSNLLEVYFPKYTEATINTTLDNDTEFLEGMGINYGVNIFTWLDDEESDKVVSKKSYYKYIRNKKTPETTPSYLCNNIFGEKIYSNSILKQYTLIPSFSVLGNSEELKKEGGYLNLLGVVECNIYRIINNYSILKIKEKEKINIISLPIIEIEEKDNTGMKFTIDQVNKRLIYSPNTSNKPLSSIIMLKLRNLNPITNEIEELLSEGVKLIQSN